LDPALESAIEQPLFNVIASSLSQSAVPGAAASQAEEAPQTTSDAHTADLLLAVTENGEPQEPESTEFVGASDQRDAASEVLELPPSLTEEDVKGPSPN
jgi:hypothetical protein